MCSLRTPRPICRSSSRPTYRSICRSTYRPMLDRYVGRHRDRHIGRGVLVEPRSICRPICRPVCRPICRPLLERYVGRYSGRHSADTLTVEYRSSVGGLSVECRWSIGRLSYNIRESVDMSTDISVEYRSICRPTVDRYVGRDVDRHIVRGVRKLHMILLDLVLQRCLTNGAIQCNNFITNYLY